MLGIWFGIDFSVQCCYVQACCVATVLCVVDEPTETTEKHTISQTYGMELDCSVHKHCMYHSSCNIEAFMFSPLAAAVNKSNTGRYALCIIYVYVCMYALYINTYTPEPFEFAIELDCSVHWHPTSTQPIATLQSDCSIHLQ